MTIEARTAPSVTIVVVTYDLRRHTDIANLIGTISLQESQDIEVIFVVEKSKILSDIISSLCKAHLKCEWTVVFNEGVPGISAARNLGADHSSGHVIAFVDDDVSLPPTWAGSLLKDFGDSAVAAVTGGAKPRWVGGEVRWLPVSLYWLIGSTTWYHPRAKSEIRSVWGMNMAFSRFVFEQGIRFPQNVGGMFGSRLHGEEQFICFEIRRRLAKKIIYDPSVRVEHSVRPERLSIRSIWKNSFYMGASRRMIRELHGNSQILSMDYDLSRGMIVDGIIHPLFSLISSPLLALRKIALTLIVFVAALAGYLFSTGLKAPHRSR